MFAIRLARIPRFRANLGEARSAGLRQASGNCSFGPPPARPRHSKSRTFRNAASPWASRSSNSTTIDNAAFTLEGSLLLRAQTERLPDWLSTDDEEGSERLARVARRGTEIKPSQAVRRIATRYEKTARAYLNAMHRSRKALRLETNLLWTWSGFEVELDA